MIKKASQFLTFISLFCFMSAVFCLAATLDKVIVVVNGETITQAELDAAAEIAIEKLKGQFSQEEISGKIEKYRKEILNRMIEEKLILSEAKKKGIKATDAQIEEKLKAVESRFESKEKFDEALKEGDLPLNELKQKYTEQIITAELIDREVRRRIIITPAETLEYYEKHKEEFKEPEQVRLKNILIKPEGGLTDEDARRLAENTLGFIKAGENFDELALKYSKGPNADKGGDLGFVKRGQLLKEIDDVVFNLNAGQVSEVIKTNLGYHIFKLEDKRPEGIKGFDEIKGDIEQFLYMEKGKERYKQWVEGLKKNAYISFR